MIIGEAKGDILTTKDGQIIFPLNSDGYNYSGFAGRVAKLGFNEILNTKNNQLGEVLEKTINGITYHGIICYSLKFGGWTNTPNIILNALNQMEFDETASIVSIGKSPSGEILGASWDDIKSVLSRCNKRLTIWYPT